MGLVTPRALLSLARTSVRPVSPGSMWFSRQNHMSTPMTPAVPTLAQLIAQMLIPCLPHIFMASDNPVLHDPTLTADFLPQVSQQQLNVGTTLWQDLWPDISRDYETVTAVQKVARNPDSPLWQSTLEQGLISILSKNEALAQKLAKRLRDM